MPSYRPGHSCELLPGRQHLGTTFYAAEETEQKTKNPYCNSKMKLKIRKRKGDISSNSNYDGVKVGSAFYEGHRCLLLENKIY